MSYTLKVYLSGLCAFVWNPTKKRYRVVLVNAAHPYNVLPDSSTIQEHAATFHARKKFIKSNEKKKMNVSGMASLFLEGVDIKLENSDGKPVCVGPLDRRLTEDFLNRKQPPDPTREKQRRDLGWMPQIHDIVPGRGKMNEVCLTHSPKDHYVDLGRLTSARLTIDTGHLEVEDILLHEESAKGYIYSYRPLYSPLHIPRAHVLPTRVVWTLKNLKQDVAFKFKPYRGKKEKSVVVGPCKKGETVRVNIENYPWRDIMQSSVEFHPHHFKGFYKLCHPPLGPGDNLPIPMKQEVSNIEVFHARYVPCMATSFADDDKA